MGTQVKSGRATALCCDYSIDLSHSIGAPCGVYMFTIFATPLCRFRHEVSYCSSREIA